MKCFVVPMPIGDVGIDVARPSNELNLFEGKQAGLRWIQNSRVIQANIFTNEIMLFGMVNTKRVRRAVMFVFGEHFVLSYIGNDTTPRNVKEYIKLGDCVCRGWCRT